LGEKGISYLVKGIISQYFLNSTEHSRPIAQGVIFYGDNDDDDDDNDGDD